eukprot:COSAG01_NODE_5759_length_4052_cov_3.703263_1_plen_74_part_00
MHSRTQYTVYSASQPRAAMCQLEPTPPQKAHECRLAGLVIRELIPIEYGVEALVSFLTKRTFINRPAHLVQDS